ncbi:hypothetical protein [Streptomyces sp. NPDC047097]|uniref:hypothetical protein n=1 Tax=Streptomyces sp. NPDC047097 TaxID=3155260 RepID=UPI0033F52B58
MSGESKIYEYEIASGKVFIEVISADRRTFTDYSTGSGVPGEAIEPRVRLSTDPEFKGDVDLGFVKVRGRKYAIENYVKRLPEGHGILRLNQSGIEMRWSSEPSYSGGFRNDRGSRVAYQAKAYDALSEIERQALDRFHEEHPEWVVESTRQLFQYQVSRYANDARRRLEEAEKANAKAAKWQARISGLPITA